MKPKAIFHVLLISAACIDSAKAGETIFANNPLYREAKTYAERVLSAKSTKCGGDLYFKALLPRMLVPKGAPENRKFLVDMKSGKIDIALSAADSEADKLNGVVAAGSMHFLGKAFRIHDGHQWGEYGRIDTFPVPQSIEFRKKKGQWELSPMGSELESYDVNWLESPGDCAAILKLGG